MAGSIWKMTGRALLGVSMLGQCLVPVPARAELLSFQEQYHYAAGEADSKLSCRAVSLLEVKRLLLERLGTYIESSSQVVDLQLSSDVVTSLSAGIVKTEILDEQWDGKTYSLTARIQADPEEVNRLVAEIATRSRQQAELAQLEKSNQDDLARHQQLKEEMLKIQHDRERQQAELAQLEKLNQDGLERLNRLKEEMTAIQNDMMTANQDYRQADRLLDSWGAYERGLEELRAGKFPEAAASFSRAIAGHPTPDNYLWRSKAYRKAGDSKRALEDLGQVIRLDPKVAEAYFMRGQILRDSGEKQEGLNDIRKAASLGNGKAGLWLKAKGKW